MPSETASASLPLRLGPGGFAASQGPRKQVGRAGHEDWMS